jgi:hypothetical protein
MRMTRWTKTWIIAASLSGLLFVLDLWLHRQYGIRFNYEFWTSLPAKPVIFGFFGLFSALALWSATNSRQWKALYAMGMVFGFILLSFLAFLGSEMVYTVELDTTTVHVKEYRFWFDGSDTFYKQDNVFFSHYIARFDQHEDYSTTYEYDGDVLTATGRWYNDNTDVTIIDVSQE